MEIINLTCNDDTVIQCHNMILQKYPTVTGILHIAGKHILTFPNEYDNNGHLKDNTIHETGKYLSGHDSKLTQTQIDSIPEAKKL